MALQQKKVSGFVGSELMLLKFKQDAESSPVKLDIIEDPLFVEPWGIGMAKGEDGLRTEVNKVLSGLEASGKMQVIFRSEGRRGGEGCVSTGRARGVRGHLKKK